MLYSISVIHYESKFDLTMLDYTLESLIKNNVGKCLVSMSFNNYEVYHQFKKIKPKQFEKYGNKILIYNYYKKLFFHDHIKLLYEKMKLFVKSTDKIIFFNSPDLLIELPNYNNHQVVLGYQYVTGFDEDSLEKINNLNTFKKLLGTHNVNFWNKIIDLSGFICTFEIFSVFIEKFDIIDKIIELNKKYFSTQNHSLNSYKLLENNINENLNMDEKVIGLDDLDELDQLDEILSSSITIGSNNKSEINLLKDSALIDSLTHQLFIDKLIKYLESFQGFIPTNPFVYHRKLNVKKESKPEWKFFIQNQIEILNDIKNSNK
jgi:hypothetical protein